MVGRSIIVGDGACHFSIEIIYAMAVEGREARGVILLICCDGLGSVGSVWQDRKMA